jgi:hypothetical protein
MAWAVRLAGVERSYSNATQHINPTRNRLKMSWINALPISTKMIELQSGWYRADHQFVGHTVSSFFPPVFFAVSEHPVAAEHLRPKPYPTSPCFSNVIPEAI